MYLEPAVNYTRPSFSKREAGCVSFAKPLWQEIPKESKPSKVRNARSLGLLYERKVLKFLTNNYPLFVSHLPFYFNGSCSSGKAIPDGVAFSFDLSIITIVEVKLSHGTDGWHQLTNLYLPIVRKSFPKLIVKRLEITRSPDMTISLPGAALLLNDFKSFFNSKEGVDTLGVYSWRR
jgi:hypothetical protein